MKAIWIGLVCLVSVGCAAQDEPGYAANEVTRVQCVNDVAMATYHVSAQELSQSLSAVAHLTQYRNEQLQDVPVNVSTVPGAVQATAPCMGGLMVDFVRRPQ